MPNESEKSRQDQNQGKSPDKGGGSTRPRTDDPSRGQDFNYEDEINAGEGKKAGSSKQPSGQPSQPWQDRDEGNTNSSKH
jgi:hypothetical protein